MNHAHFHKCGHLYVYDYLILFLDIAGCEGLTPPGYGRIVSTTGNNIDDTTTFECDEGFTLIGSVTRRCLSNGQWSGVPTQCAGKLVR